MRNKTELRFDRDLQPVTSDGGDWKSRIYAKAEARQRESKHEEGRQSLRDRIGVERPPQTLREKIMAKTRAPKPPTFDVRAELKKAREERERKARIHHP